MGFKIVIVGVIGNVGWEMLDIFVECGFLVDEVVVFVFCCLQGIEVFFGDKMLKVQVMENYDFFDIDICLMFVGGIVFKEWFLCIGVKGCVVIDNLLVWCYDVDVLLIVLEVNVDVIIGYIKKNIIVNLNCFIVQLVVVLKLFYDVVKIKCVVVFIYQLVLGGGKEVMEELFNQMCVVFVNDLIELVKFIKWIVFNVIFYIDSFMEDGYIKEEWKVLVEIKKMLDLVIKVICIVVCVLVFIGYLESVNIEFENEIIVEEVCNILCEVLGCFVIDKQGDGGYIILYESVGEDVIYILCICEDVIIENGLNMWVVFDNLCKGVVLNIVQIVEVLVNCGLIMLKKVVV